MTDWVSGRKLRCSTDRPRCSNCAQRDLVCTYGEPRRRGPGKAPRGSKTKKKKKGELSSTSSTEEFQPVIPGYMYPFPPHGTPLPPLPPPTTPSSVSRTNKRTHSDDSLGEEAG